MKTLRGAALAAIAAFVCIASAFGSIAVSTSTAYTQNFDGMGTPATSSTGSTAPTDFRVDNPATVRTVGSFAAASTNVPRAGGASLSTTASNGIYNFGSGTASLGGSDRAVGFLSSGSATASGNLYAQLVNNTGADLLGLQISYGVEKYRGGSNAAGFRIQLFYSTDGATWTNAGSDFLTSFGGDANNSGFATVPGTTVSVAKSLSVAIPSGSNFYLAWNYSVASGTTTTNAQALAIDDVTIMGIAAAGTPTNPAGTGTANPSSVQAGTSTVLTVAVTPGTNPTSTGIAVAANLSTIGGLASQQFFDDGTHGDTVAGDNTFTFAAAVPVNTPTGARTIPVTITDAQSRSGAASISLTVTPPPTPPAGSGSATPNALLAGGSTLLSVSVTPGQNPTSTGINVLADLSAIGGSSAQAFNAAGGNSFSFTATVASAITQGPKTFPVTITDAQGRSGTTSIALTIVVSSSPSGSATTTPSSLLPGAPTTITVTTTPGANPQSTGITVTGDLTSIGGSATQAFADNGNGTFSLTATVASTTSIGSKTLPLTIADAQSRTSTTNAFVTVQPPTTVRISQVYGGGGNSGATYTNDFVELFNSGSTPVSLDGWSVQATSAAGTASWTANGAPTLLSGVIQPGHYYLVQESQGSNGTTPLPAADATGVITMSATNAKVALVASVVPLSACPSAAVVDLLGYGTASCFEGNPTPALSNTTAAIRDNNGCIDTNNNLADFSIGGPVPRNSASPVNTCGGDPSQPSGFGNATPNALEPASNTLLTVTVAPATLPPSTHIVVVANLSSIGGSAMQQFFDDGTSGDATAGDNKFSFLATIDRLTSIGAKSILATITDDQGRTATAPITLTAISPSCGVERWSVKVGVDPDATLVNLNNPFLTTITNLGNFPAPADPPGPPDNARVAPWETTVYTINGTLTLYKKEADVDYHIVIQDEQGNTVITEIPSPACIITSTAPRVPAASPFTSGINLAREKFDARLNATTSFQSANLPVRVTGVAFFDFIHGQMGVAPNGIELHPLLDITFLTPTTTTLSSTPNPSQYGTTVTFSATVANIGGPTPTGNVTFSDGPNTIATRILDRNGVATYTTNSLSVGSHAIGASYEGDTSSAPSVSGIKDVQQVNKADQTITFTPIANKVYGDAAFTVNATAGGSTSPVTFAATGNCTSTGLNGSTITITAAGTCTVTASQLGDGNYNAAADVSQTFGIAQASAVVVVSGYTGVYDATAHGATGTATGAFGEDLSSLLNLGASFTNVPGGKAHWTFAGNSNYAASSGEVTITLTQASVTTAVNGYSGVYDALPHGATGSATGISGENLTSLLNFGASFTNVPGGTAHWTFAGNTNYAPSSGEVTITITQASAAITVHGYSGIYDALPHGATGSATGVSGENLTPLLNLGASFTNVPGGKAHWTFAGNTNYAPSSGDLSIAITQASASIQVNGYSGVYDGLPHGAAGAATGVAGENLTPLLNLGVTFTNVPGGSASWSFAGNLNYASASGATHIQINPANPIVTVTNPNPLYDGTPKPATASATGVGGVTVAGAFSFTYNGSPSAPTLPGSYGVVASFNSADTNYANTTGTGTLTIRGLRDDLQSQLNAIAALRSNTTNKQDLDRLNAAINDLGEALEPDQWLDTIHGTNADGNGIFTNAKNALIPMLAIIKDAKTSLTPASLQPIVAQIVSDTRQVALTAINDAAARAANVDKARAELAAGDKDIQAGQYESGMEHYRNAWNASTKL